MIKTINIDTLTWFDKNNGVTYFSSLITTDINTGKGKQYRLPFQSGYGSHDYYEALRLLADKGVVRSYNSAFKRNRKGTLTIHNTQRPALKREVIAHGKDSILTN